MSKPGAFRAVPPNAHTFTCGLCHESSIYYSRNLHAAATEAQQEGCKPSMVHGWLCPACTVFYAATGAFERPEEQMPF